MPKSLKDILQGVKKSKEESLKTGDNPGVDYADKMKDSRDFVASHKVEKHEDRVGNGDYVYKATNISGPSSEGGKHGHIPDPKSHNEYKKANEELEILSPYISVSNKLSEAKKMKGKDPCWSDYEMIGTKIKNGKEVPNCVPKESTITLKSLKAILEGDSSPTSSDTSKLRTEYAKKKLKEKEKENDN